ncbi:unnamed protein product [marine sediment metagenome]|uniref:Uncharacterized protein n=1 Tax=marine sediment metagenome TaxID=412755 RepID=X1BTG1_9ZZZZ
MSLFKVVYGSENPTPPVPIPAPSYPDSGFDGTPPPPVNSSLSRRDPRPPMEEIPERPRRRSRAMAPQPSGYAPNPNAFFDEPEVLRKGRGPSDHSTPARESDRGSFEDDRRVGEVDPDISPMLSLYNFRQLMKNKYKKKYKKKFEDQMNAKPEVPPEKLEKDQQREENDYLMKEWGLRRIF